MECKLCKKIFNELVIYRKSKYIRQFCSRKCQNKYFSLNNPMNNKEIIKLISLKRRKTSSNRPIECFWDKAGCLICTSHPKNQGYPQINRDGKHWVLSRWIFYINNGYIPKIVMHTCDNPSCINPNHLLAGTIKENATDMKNKGRAPKGENKPKLNIEQIREIKSLIPQLSLQKIADKYNVSKKLILLIKQGKKWKNV